ncbi:ribonuclease HI [Streptococcus salivarius]|nr:ribonuclease HI [Streptococcus salivarius]
MMVNKYYAVRKGKIPGIYESWGEAETQVKGYSGAEYKSFKTLEEADIFMFQDSVHASVADIKIDKLKLQIEQEIENLDDDTVFAFVDGSYSPNTKDKKPKYSYGAILLTKGAENRLYKSFVDSEGLESRNVSGEIAGAKAAITWAIGQQKQNIKIFYDYEGIEKWAVGEWAAKKAVAKDYVAFIKSSEKHIHIEFQRTPGHSGIKYNEEADALAKAALDDRSYRTGNDGSVYVIGISVRRWIEVLSELKYVLACETNNESNLEFDIIEIKENHKRIKVSINDDGVTINNYHDINSFIQGKSNTVLFDRIINVVIDEIDNEDKVIEVLNVYHALTLTSLQVETQFTKLMPNYPTQNQNLKHKKMLLTAVYNTMLTGYMPDYTHLLHPIFRAMEYYLHRILHDKERKETTRTNSYGKSSNNFSFFDYNEETRSYVYNSNSSLNDKELGYLNKLYNKYNQMRHPYSHTPATEIDISLITSISEARNLIIDSLQLFDEYYIIFH